MTAKLKELWQNKLARRLLFALVGGLGGFAYYYHIGCPTGGCAISSNPYLMTAFGLFFGWSMVSD